jgi:hypothetical protein
MNLSINTEGLDSETVLAVTKVLALGGEDQAMLAEINAIRPGIASLPEVEEAEAEPQVSVAIMFSVSETTDLDALLETLNAILAAEGLSGDADWVDLIDQEPEASE